MENTERLADEAFGLIEKAMQENKRKTPTDIADLIKAFFANSLPYSNTIINTLKIDKDMLIKDIDIFLDGVKESEGKLTNDLINNLINKLYEEIEGNISYKDFVIELFNEKTLVSKVLKKYDLIKSKVKEIVNSFEEDKKSGKVISPELFSYGKNVNELIKNGEVDNVIGRKEELKIIVEILSRKTKNNCILVGENGIGKKSIIYLLAQNIVNGETNNILENKIIFQLDTTQLIAGASLRGDVEKRISAIVKYIEETNGKVILFISDIQTLVNGQNKDESKIGTILKPFLESGKIRIIGTIDNVNFKSFVEKDSICNRYFQNVFIEEPNAQETISILNGIKHNYEVFHGVTIDNSAILSSVELSEKYITDRFLPEKAIDLIDQASSLVKMEISGLPANLQEKDKEISQVEIEIEFLKMKKTLKNETKIKELNIKLKTLKNEFEKENIKWKEEVNLFNEIKKLNEEKDTYQKKIPQLNNNKEYSKIAEIEYEIIPNLEEEIKKIEKQINSSKKVTQKNNIVSENSIAKIIARWTGIPVTKLVEDEVKKLANIEEELAKKIIGQKEAITSIANAIRRARAGLKNPNKPIGSFLFLGPTGVGKTYITKVLTQYLFNNQDALIRLDMSEYMEKHAVSKLIGSPPGYVGYDEGGQLTEAVRRKPYSIILFDEVEKAHPDVFNLLLQLLDDGRLTDSKGRLINFKNTIIILTSNIGAGTIMEYLSDDKKDNNSQEKLKEAIMPELKSFFRPEFLNRLEEIIMFEPISKEMLLQIASIQLKELKDMAYETKQINLDISEKAKTFIVEKGWDPALGARPLQRAIQEHLIDKLSLHIIKENIKSETIIKVDEKDGKLLFS